MKEMLIQTQKACAAWRLLGHKNFNVELRRQIVSCLTHYNHKQLSDALGITDKTLRNWEKSLNQTDKQQANYQKPMFVPLSLSNPKSANQNSSSHNIIQITLPNGITLNVSFQNSAETVSFIMSLNKEMNACST